MSEQVSAEQIAAFDQAYAYSNGVLDRIIDTYRGARIIDACNGVPELVTVVVLSQLLHEKTDADEVASALACAIVRLAK